MAAKLLKFPNESAQTKPMLTDHDWLANLDSTASGGILSEEERMVISFCKTGLPSDYSGVRSTGKITEVERKLLDKMKKNSGHAHRS